MPNLHWQESPYLIFLEVVRNFLQSWSTIFPGGVAGVVRQQIHGNIHTLPPTRSTPKPHVPKLIWGVLSLFLTPIVGFLVVFVLNLRFECGGLAIAKVRFEPVCGVEKKIQDFFSRPVAHIGGFYRPKPNLHWQESPYFIFLGYLRPHSRPQNTLKKQKWSVKADHPCIGSETLVYM